MAEAKLADRFVGLAEAAQYTGLSQRTLTYEISAGRLPAFKTKPTQKGHIRIRLSDLEALMTQFPVVPTGQ